MGGLSTLTKLVSLGSSSRTSNMVMEYSDHQMEEYIMDNTNKIKEMAMDIRNGQMAKNSMGTLKINYQTETDYSKRAAYYTT
jgi:hypothetical protein